MVNIVQSALEMEVLYGFMGKSWEYMGIPSGNLFHSYGKWTIIDDLAIKRLIFHSYVSLPEGKHVD